MLFPGQLLLTCGSIDTEIAREYWDKGLRAIGISLEEPSSSLEQFVNGQGAKMDYTVRPLAGDLCILSCQGTQHHTMTNCFITMCQPSRNMVTTEGSIKKSNLDFF